MCESSRQSQCFEQKNSCLNILVCQTTKVSAEFTIIWCLFENIKQEYVWINQFIQVSIFVREKVRKSANENVAHSPLLQPSSTIHLFFSSFIHISPHSANAILDHSKLAMLKVFYEQLPSVNFENLELVYTDTDRYLPKFDYLGYVCTGWLKPELSLFYSY